MGDVRKQEESRDQYSEGDPEMGVAKDGRDSGARL
jgi:hypothetical protein